MVRRQWYCNVTDRLREAIRSMTAAPLHLWAAFTSSSVTPTTWWQSTNIRKNTNHVLSVLVAVLSLLGMTLHRYGTDSGMAKGSDYDGFRSSNPQSCGIKSPAVHVNCLDHATYCQSVYIEKNTDQVLQVRVCRKHTDQVLQVGVFRKTHWLYTASLST